MKRSIESLINDITMYRLVLYGLIFTAGAAFVLSAAGILELSPLALLTSLVTLLLVSYGSSRLLAGVFHTTHNRESWAITALILFFLLLPPKTARDVGIIALVAVMAMASKYILTVHQRHVFNPAAIAVALASLFGLVHAGWWVGTPYLLPVVAIVGVLVVWKVRRFVVVSLFMTTAVGTALLVGLIRQQDLFEVFSVYVLSGPLLFAATIMLTEPLTAPTTRKWQLIYAVLIGFLMTCKITPAFTPEVAIVLGNVFAFWVSGRHTLRFEFVSMRAIAPRIFEVIVRPLQPLGFKPGQYLELSLPHSHADARGMRRSFSIASSPQDEFVHFGIVMPEPGSSFKRALMSLKKGTVIRGTQLAGDFTLPTDTAHPLLLIAGGIGVTPYRSMLDDMTRRKESRDTVLLHGVRSEEVLVYQDTMKAAAKYGLRYTPIVTQPSPDWKGEAGLLTIDMIEKYAPDFKQRRIYISGPSLMVDSVRSQLVRAGVSRKNIVNDYFTGY